MVECDLAKVEVAGSTPVSRSIVSRGCPTHPRGFMLSGPAQAGTQFRARYPSGKGEVCKTFMRRFDSDPRLQSFNHLQARLKKVAAVWLPIGCQMIYYQHFPAPQNALKVSN